MHSTRVVLLSTVEETLLVGGLPGSALGLEITGSVLMTDLTRVHLTLTCLRALGVPVAIDDFGTGYSSLSYTTQFPITTVKIDGSFTAGLGDPGRRRESFAVVTAVIGLAHALHLRVIAEGIEKSTQAQILHGLGYGHGQGYLFGRPAPAQVRTELSPLADIPSWPSSRKNPLR
jgi:EAL domain-containing protein (putative c-di-GMP-specific phosphodiesterase class I)